MSDAGSHTSHLLVRAGGYVCALPLGAVRRVVRSLVVHPLLGGAPELKGLAEFAGEPLPVLDLARLVGGTAEAAGAAHAGAPVTIVAWAGPAESREMVGLSVDAALEVVEVPPETVVGGVGGAGGLVAGEAAVHGQVVRVLDLAALGAGVAR